jgi:hypothetical protein
VTFSKFYGFIEKRDLEWKKYFGVCADGAA